MVLSITGKTCIIYDEAHVHTHTHTELSTMSRRVSTADVIIQRHSISWHMVSKLLRAERCWRRGWVGGRGALIWEHHVPAMTRR